MRKVWLAIAVLIGTGVALLFPLKKHTPPPPNQPEADIASLFQVSNLAPPKILAPPKVPAPASNLPPVKMRKYMLRADEFTEADWGRFTSDFEAHIKPAFSNWCRVYADYAPFDLGRFTTNAFTVKVGRGDYMFTIDGVTVGVRHATGYAGDVPAFVSYMDNHGQSRMMMELPTDGKPPNLRVPVTRDQVIEMLGRDAGIRYPPDKIRMHPTGLSGALAGGVRFDVGGDPNNGISWDFALVFGPDNKLVYYDTAPFKVQPSNK